MESTELVRRLSEQGHVVELIESLGGDLLIRVDDLCGIPLPWAERLASGEITLIELKEELLNP